MVIALIIAITAVALFLIFRDDHDDSYTRSEKPKPVKKPVSKPVQQPAAPPRPAMRAPRTIVPEEKQYRPRKLDEGSSPVRRNRSMHRPRPARREKQSTPPHFPMARKRPWISVFWTSRSEEPHV